MQYQVQMDTHAAATPSFMFATGIENSYPVITGADGQARRVDEMAKCGHYDRWQEDFALVREMGVHIGRSMRAAGVHQGLAPVLDVTRDYRWGRTEETIGEDPYLVGTVGAGYVRGLEDAGVVATLKHFAGYSASRGGRNLAPVSMGQRELRDVILPPFEMAVWL